MPAMLAASAGLPSSVCPTCRAVYSLISQVAWPSITESRAVEPSSLLFPCLM